MDQLVLQARSRTRFGKQVNALRRQGQLPGIIYGHKIDARPVELDQIPFDKLYAQAGESSLVDVTIDGQAPLKVLIQDVARDPLSGEIIHVDFHQVDMKEKITTEISLNFIGEAAAVKELGGVFVANHDKIEVECLPNDLVPAIDVDISVLKTFEDSITIGSLTIPKGLEVKAQPDEVVALVTPPRSDAELAALEEEVTEDVAGIEKVETKKETEEPVEGEEAPAAEAAPPAKEEKKS